MILRNWEIGEGLPRIKMDKIKEKLTNGYYFNKIIIIIKMP